MTDVDQRFRSLDSVAAPDLWADIEIREPHPTPQLHRARTAIVLLTAFALVVGGLAWVAFQLGRGDEVPSPVGTHLGTPLPSSTGQPVSTSGLVAKGKLECTAVFPSSVLRPGTQTGVEFRVTNHSAGGQPVAVGTGGASGTLEFRTEDGLVLADSASMNEGGIGPPSSGIYVPPGESTSIVARDPSVIWPGPLVVTPTCAGRRLPPVTLSVGGAGAPQDSEQALDGAIDSLSPVLDRCRPLPVDGAPNAGTVQSRGRDFEARCVATFDANPRFWVVTVAAFSPPDGNTVDLRFLRDEIRAVPMLDIHGPVAVNWWVVVVDRGGATIARHMSVAIGCNGSRLSSGGGIQSCDFPTGPSTT